MWRSSIAEADKTGTLLYQSSLALKKIRVYGDNVIRVLGRRSSGDEQHTRYDDHWRHVKIGKSVTDLETGGFVCHGHLLRAMERCQAHIDHLGNLISISEIYNAALRRPYPLHRQKEGSFPWHRAIRTLSRYRNPLALNEPSAGGGDRYLSTLKFAREGVAYPLHSLKQVSCRSSLQLEPTLMLANFVVIGLILKKIVGPPLHWILSLSLHLEEPSLLDQKILRQIPILLDLISPARRYAVPAMLCLFLSWTLSIAVVFKATLNTKGDKDRHCCCAVG